ncbi:MAG: 4Fe-4S dicluster domain-containing protein [Chloroflexi bacterium]|nr:4Fe-4S dicluster domain-containing protein [Chloroflexota bacterium]
MGEVSNSDLMMTVGARWCTGCQRCIRGCPKKAIRYDKFTGIVVIDQDTCNRCRVCLKFCPIEGALVLNGPTSS